MMVSPCAERMIGATGDRGQGRIGRLVDQLKSLHQSERAALELIAAGSDALPALRRVVFEREPSGLFQARCLAVRALSALGAQDVLVEFLTISPRAVAAPVERAGEEAVINAAARALAGVRDEATFQLLLRLAAQPSLAGVLETLGEFRRPEAIPYFIAALADDLGRGAAEVALRKLDAAALPALIGAAAAAPEADPYEHASSLRRRRSALALLLEIGVPAPAWEPLRHLIHDPDAEIACLACEIGLAVAPLVDRPPIIDRSIELLASLDWPLGSAIEDRLVACFASARASLTRALSEDRSTDQQPWGSPRRRAILRIWGRATGQAPALPSEAASAARTLR